MAAHRFVALDGLRGIAAIAVVGLHAWVLFGQQLVPHGYLGVDFFFGLSGFVIAHAYEQRLRDGLSVRRFLVARVVRLSPMIVAGVVLGAVASAVCWRPDPLHLAFATLAQLLTLPSPWVPDVGYGLWPVNPPIWSLFWEIMANLVFVLWGYRQPTHRLAMIAGLAALGLVAIVVLKGTLETGFTQRGFVFGSVRVAFSFTMGLLLHRWSPGRIPGLDRISSIVLASLTGSLFFIPIAVSPGVVDLVLTVVVFPMLIVAAAQSRSVDLVWEWLGRVSYPLYLMHFPILTVFIALPVATGTEQWAVGAVYIVLAIVAAHLALVLYDEPLRQYLGQRLRRRTEEKRGPAAMPHRPLTGRLASSSR